MEKYNKIKLWNWLGFTAVLSIHSENAPFSSTLPPLPPSPPVGLWPFARLPFSAAQCTTRVLACSSARHFQMHIYIYIYLLWARARPQFFWLLSQNFHVGEASVLYLWCACETTGYLGFEMSPRAYTFDSRVVCRSPRVCERMNEWVSEMWTRPVYSHNEHHVHALHIIHSTCLHYTYCAVLCMPLFDGCFTPDSWILNQNGLRILISIITVAIPYTPEYRSTPTH